MKLAPSPFDTQFYERKIGRLVADRGDDGETLANALERARVEKYDAMFLRLPQGDPLCSAVERVGLRAVDHLVVSVLDRARAVPAPPSAVSVTHHERLEAAEDIEAIVAITSTIRHSHLHADPRLPLERTRALYAAWAHNDVTGRAVRTITARSHGSILGYITIIETEGGLALDLVAVREDQQGRGIGSAMLASTIAWVADSSVAVTVGTQQTNPALALYGRFGFVPRDNYLTYHLWLTDI